MATNFYGLGAVTLDGVLLTEATQIESTLESADVDNNTILGGFSGKTVFGGKRITRVTGCILAAGTEVNLEQLQITRALVVCSVQMIGSGESTNDTGWIQNVSRKIGVGSQSEYSFEHHAPESAFE
jgi:hypothetical protein